MLRRMKGAGKGVTLADVAREAGVSSMTVSRALNRPDIVTVQVRERVQAAVDALGYIPNRMAGTLAGGAPVRLLPMVLPTLHHSVYVPFLEGVQRGLTQPGWQLAIDLTEYDPQREWRAAEQFLSLRPDVMVLAGTDHDPRVLPALWRFGVRIIEVMDAHPDPADLLIGYDHAQAGTMAARHLIERGYRHLAYASCLGVGDARNARRMQAFQAEAESCGVPCAAENVEEPSSYEVGVTLLRRLLTREPGVDAIYFSNDDVAAGALFECLRQGLSVPGRVAILGHNDMSISAHVHPALSTVATPREEIGAEVARRLNAPTLKGGLVTFPCELRPRQTT